ncbi:glycosyltransferase [Dictyobacter arantiisoli]|uniref:Glycosyl transferase family 1 n=1 Tax=Dictyobacter arantiisoli TaxID=2014874 RepID=A0A5A5T850_9CHLR|nr:glycosyltransferase [Dictyobacter arantiisoli]GCF07134.1 glycosyl transferase family 1 [Dictyobacter arantiisoli]
MLATKNKHVRILALGTRGDIQPYIALGLGLQQAGFDISVGTNANFKSFVEEQGLPCLTVEWDLVTIMDRMDQEIAEGMSASRADRNARQTFLRLLRETLPSLVEGADVLIYSFIGTFSVPHIAEKLGIQSIPAHLHSYILPTRAFPCIGMPLLPLGCWYNQLTYTLFERLSSLAMRPALNKWRQQTLHLDLYTKSMFAPILATDRPLLYAFSPIAFPKPADWGEHVHLTGFWFLPAPKTWQPTAELLAFLKGGPPPVYIGFGSMRSQDTERVSQCVLDAVKQTGVRAILATGWGGLMVSEAPENVLLLESVPHDWLLPRVAAAIHHGGPGTTGASLRAGIPTLVVPFAPVYSEQLFWGKRVAALGVGPDPIPVKKLSVNALSSAIHRMLEDQMMRKKAAILGQQIRAEDGVGNAVSVLRSIL